MGNNAYRNYIRYNVEYTFITYIAPKNENTGTCSILRKHYMITKYPDILI